MSVDNSTQTNPNSTAQTTPDIFLCRSNDSSCSSASAARGTSDTRSYCAHSPVCASCGSTATRISTSTYAAAKD